MEPSRLPISQHKPGLMCFGALQASCENPEASFIHAHPDPSRHPTSMCKYHHITFEGVGMFCAEHLWYTGVAPCTSGVPLGTRLYIPQGPSRHPFTHMYCWLPLGSFITLHYI